MLGPRQHKFYDSGKTGVLLITKSRIYLDFCMVRLIIVKVAYF